MSSGTLRLRISVITRGKTFRVLHHLIPVYMNENPHMAVSIFMVVSHAGWNVPVRRASTNATPREREVTAMVKSCPTCPWLVSIEVSSASVT